MSKEALNTLYKLRKEEINVIYVMDDWTLLFLSSKIQSDVMTSGEAQWAKK